MLGAGSESESAAGAEGAAPGGANSAKEMPFLDD